MLLMHIPCPWPIEYHARFDWTKVEYQYQPNYVNVLGTIKSQVSFYVDNHVPDCEYILAYMNDRCAIQSYYTIVSSQLVVTSDTYYKYYIPFKCQFIQYQELNLPKFHLRWEIVSQPCQRYNFDSNQ